MSHALPTPDVYRLAPAQGARLFPALVTVAGLGGGVSLVGWFAAGSQQFFFSYLTAFLFVLSIGVGALFWIMIHHVTHAGWSVVVRRLAENVAAVMPVLAVLFVPVILGASNLYAWTHDDDHDPHLAAKKAYLNVPFFVIRAVIYFGVWSFLAWKLTTGSTRQDDSGDPQWTRRLQRLSAPGLLLLGLTTTFAAFDWIMSLDYHWYSTIFGVYFWAGSFVASLSVIILLVIALRAAGLLTHTITLEHQHDLGKLLFGFVIFGTYIAFSQYFLIWYGNIPEETVWFIRREQGGWYDVGWALFLGRFILPFAVLMPRWTKRNPRVLGFIAGWLLLFQYLDLYWQVMPTLHQEDVAVHWLDFTLPITLTAACAAAVWRVMRRHALIPVRDPRLDESLRFHNE